ncbi:glycosyltransferase [Nocardia sp. XZ_19_231]|uniref:galactofuranosyltransferase GlfT1 n=1 Tax=Nocardia TaxID=1817 RepID=UPI001E413A9A|nr:glycosyltransferase family 2 protein [Nocardia sp. XZ_19_231]
MSGQRDEAAPAAVPGGFSMTDRLEATPAPVEPAAVLPDDPEPAQAVVLADDAELPVGAEPADITTDTGPTARIIAVVVTHKRRELLAESLKVLASQSRPVDHLIVVDNANEDAVAELVAQQPIEATYLGSRHNLGGAGGFALGMLHALTQGADWVWLADDDGRPDGPEVLAKLIDCARRHNLVEVSPVVCDIDEPDRLAFPLRRGVVWRRLRSELGDEDFLPGIASLFNGALISAKAVDLIGVPDLRLFVRGDEVEVHRRLVRSGLPFGTCLQTAYLHPNGAEEFKPILGGRMHTQYPDDPVKRYFTYRNRGYLMSQPGMRKLLPQEWIRFSWFFLVTRRDPAGLKEWFRLRSLGRNEHFGKPD